jgi:hypothetical protein
MNHIEHDQQALDAARYRWLRQQHWNEAPMCVVAQPRQAVKLGHDCPTLERLDAAIDGAMTAHGVKACPTCQDTGHVIVANRSEICPTCKGAGGVKEDGNV